jgi:hypothetical protein
LYVVYQTRNIIFSVLLELSYILTRGVLVGHFTQRTPYQNWKVKWHALLKFKEDWILCWWTKEGPTHPLLWTYIWWIGIWRVLHKERWVPCTIKSYTVNIEQSLVQVEERKTTFDCHLSHSPWHRRNKEWPNNIYSILWRTTLPRLNDIWQHWLQRSWVLSSI